MLPEARVNMEPNRIPQISCQTSPLVPIRFWYLPKDPRLGPSSRNYHCASFSRPLNHKTLPCIPRPEPAPGHSGCYPGCFRSRSRAFLNNNPWSSSIPRPGLAAVRVVLPPIPQLGAGRAPTPPAQLRGPAEAEGEMGRRASPSPSRGRRTRGAAFQRSGGGGLTEGDSETPSRETPREGDTETWRHRGRGRGNRGTRGEGTGRPREKEQGDPGRGNRKTRGEGTWKPGEREHRDLEKGNTETWGKRTGRPGRKNPIFRERTRRLGRKRDSWLDKQGPQGVRSGGSERHREPETPRETEKGAEKTTRAQRLGTGHTRTGRDGAGRREATE